MRTRFNRLVGTTGSAGKKSRIGRFVTVACYSMFCTGLLAKPAFALDVTGPFIPKGLAKTSIETNCNYFGSSYPFTQERISVGPGNAQLTMLSRALADTVTFSSSHPHLVKPKSPMNIAGAPLGQYNNKTKTTVHFNEPDKPTNIEYFVKSSYPSEQGNGGSTLSDLTSGGVSVRKLRLYPYLKFQGLTSSVENQTIKDRTPITVFSNFSYAVPDSSSPYKVSFAQARFQFGTDPTYHIAEGGWWWPAGAAVLKATKGVRKIPFNFTPKWPSNAILANKNIPTIKILFSATPVQDRCITGMPSDDLVFWLKNPNYEPNAPLPVAQKTSELNKKKPVSIIKQPVKPVDQRRR